MVRSVGGYAELLLGVGIITKLRIAVDFGQSNFRDGQGEGQEMTRNVGSNGVPSFPNGARP